MRTLLTAGYQNVKSAKSLLATAELWAAVVADIRFSPRSRNAQWSGKNLAALLRGRYVHVGELGNKNYKGGPIDLVDIEEGTKRIAELLDKQPVILLCACWSLDTCHRLLAADEIAKRLGCEVVHLQRGDMIKADNPAEPAPAIEPEPEDAGDEQLNLF